MKTKSQIFSLASKLVTFTSSAIILVMNMPEYSNSQSCCTHCTANFTTNPWKDLTIIPTPMEMPPMVDSPGNPCFKVFQKEQTCCTDTREIFEYILKRGAWSFEEAKNTYTLSSFYSIFLKEADTDVRNYLTNNLLDM